MPITFRTATYAASSRPTRLDITRVGVDRARKAGEPAPGAAFAPSPGLLWPGKRHMQLVAMLEARAAAMPAGEAAAAVAIAAAELASKADAAYRRIYLAEMRVSAGMREGAPRWGQDEGNAMRRGVRSHAPTWRALLDGTLAGDEPVLTCFCAHREPSATQRHTCHRHHLAEILVAYGAVDAGEVDAATVQPEAPPVAQGDAKPARAQRKPCNATDVASLVAVSGTRPPKAGAPREVVATYRAIMADVVATMAALPAGTVLLHGDADGVDKAAATAAAGAGLEAIAFAAWWDAWSRDAPLVRNVYCMAAPKLLAWPSRESRGTLHAMGLARRGGVEVDERRLW